MGKNNYNRQSIRLKKFDYSLSGYYFITICTEDSERLFGKIINNEMVLNDFGEIVNFEWFELKNRFDIQLHEFIVMPDHIHGIIEILVDNGMGGDNKGVINNAPTSISRDSGNYFSKISPKSNSLSIIIRSYKSCVTRNIRQNTRRGVIHNTLITNQNNNLTKTDPHQSQLTIWQRNYFERVIRNEKELNNIRQYIIDNPKNWDV